MTPSWAHRPGSPAAPGSPPGPARCRQPRMRLWHPPTLPGKPMQGQDHTWVRGTTFPLVDFPPKRHLESHQNLLLSATLLSKPFFKQFPVCSSTRFFKVPFPQNKSQPPPPVLPPYKVAAVDPVKVDRSRSPSIRFPSRSRRGSRNRRPHPQLFDFYVYFSA